MFSRSTPLSRSMSLIRISAVCLLAGSLALVAPSSSTAQMAGSNASSSKPLPSPAATATASLAGQTVTIKYNAPSVRGRKIMGGLVPYGKVWRTGANPATTLITPVPLHLGTLLVPAGTYTLYTLPEANQWMLIVNKQTGQWGTEYDQSKDLGRVPMKSRKLSSPQEQMSLSFTDVKSTSAELNLRWENTEESVKVTTP